MQLERPCFEGHRRGQSTDQVSATVPGLARLRVRYDPCRRPSEGGRGMEYRQRDGMVYGFDAWQVACSGRPVNDHPTSLGASPAPQPPRGFFISGFLRLMVSLSLLGTFNEARSVEAISHRRLFSELPLVKTLIGVFCRRATRPETCLPRWCSNPAGSDRPAPQR